MAIGEPVTLDEVRAYLDRGDHRRALAAAYPTVVRVEEDPASATSEDWQLVAMYALATAYKGDPARAVACATSAHHALRALHGPFDEATMSAQRALAVAQQAAGDLHGAIGTVEAVWALSERTRGEQAAPTLLAAADLAAAEHRIGRCDDATRRLQSTVDTYLATHGHDATSIRMLARLGAMVRDCGDFDRGHELLGQARRLAQEHVADDGLIAAITALARATVDPDHHCTADTTRPERTSGDLAVADDDAAHDSMVDAWLAAMKDTSGHRTGDPPSTDSPEGSRRAALAVLSLIPRSRQVEHDDLVAALRRSPGGTRQIAVVNPSPGSGKSVAALMLGLTFGQARGGSVLAWDHSGAPGGLGRRAIRGEQTRRVRDLHDLAQDHDGIDGFSARLWSQAGGAFDVLTSNDAGTGGLAGAAAFRTVRRLVARHYRLLIIDTGNKFRADHWLAAVDSTDQMVVPISARPGSADSAARLLDYLDRTGRGPHVRRAVVVLTMPPRTTRFDAIAVEARFGRRCRAVLRVPYDRQLDTGEIVTSNDITPASQRAWLRVAAAIAHGL